MRINNRPPQPPTSVQELQDFPKNSRLRGMSHQDTPFTDLEHNINNSCIRKYLSAFRAAFQLKMGVTCFALLILACSKSNGRSADRMVCAFYFIYFLLLNSHLQLTPPPNPGTAKLLRLLIQN